MSVVVVTRDRPHELRECLRAIAAQSYAGPLEVIVVYDRSAVEESLAGSIEDLDVRVMANERTPGLAGGRNTGLLAAEGELVAFCDDDDVWLPGKLWRQAELLAEVPDVEAVSCGIRIAHGDKRVERVPDLGLVGFRDLLASRMAELHPSTFCIRRAQLLEGIGLVDESLPGSYAEDYELLLRAAKRAPIAVVREVLVEVRWHPKSYFASQWPVISEALCQLLTSYPEFEQVRHGAARVSGQVAFAEAAQGKRASGLRWAGRTFRLNPLEPRGLLAAAVALGLVRPDTVVRKLNSRGRGI
ncbi:MAG: glycosyltransferase family 2 protein [Acidimicrobiales bacterium]